MDKYYNRSRVFGCKKCRRSFKTTDYEIKNTLYIAKCKRCGKIANKKIKLTDTFYVPHRKTRILSKLHKDRIGIANTGKTRTLAHRKKYRLCKLGVLKTEAHRKNMSIAAFKRWRRIKVTNKPEDEVTNI